MIFRIIPAAALIAIFLTSPVSTWAGPGTPGSDCGGALVRAALDASGGSVAPRLDLPRVPGSSDYGPRLVLKAEGATRDPDQIQDLTLGEYNVLNLVRLQGKAARDPLTGRIITHPETGQIQLEKPPIDKPEWAIKGVVDAIRRGGSDIEVLEEVEDIEALKALVTKPPLDVYRPALIEGNDIRGIDIGFLVRKDLPYDVYIQSYKNVANPEGAPLFSRDLPVAKFIPRGAPEGSRPDFILIGTHYKSQRGGPMDRLAEIPRGQQAAATARIIRYYQDLHGKDVPIFELGDFNRDIRQGPEFKPLWNAGMTDAFDLAPAAKSVPRDLRTTHTFHPRSGPTENSQLDGILGSEVVKEKGIVTEARILPYLDPNGNPKPVPRTFEERSTNPSDHLKLLARLDFRKIRELARQALARLRGAEPAKTH